MPSIVTKTVKPAGGGDYASLNEAFVAEELIDRGAGPGVLTGAADTVLRFECYSGVDTTPAKADGFTTDATRYVEVFAAVGHGHAGAWDNTKYRLEVSAARGIEQGSATTLHMRFKQLQVLVSGSVSSLDAYFVSGNIVGSCDFRYVNCIARAAYSGQGSGSAFRESSGADTAGTKNFRYVNCVAMNFLMPDAEAAESVAFNTFSNVSHAEYMWNCLAVSCDRGFRKRASTRAKNCVTIGCRNGYVPTEANYHANATHNASSSDVDAFSGGSNPVFHKRAAFFADPINLDFRLHQHDVLSTRPLAGIGATLSGDSDYPTDSSAAWPVAFTYDISDATRSGAWAIGPSQPTFGLAQGVWWLHCGGVTNKTAKILVRQASDSHAVSLKYGEDPNFLTFSTEDAVSLLNGRRLFSLTGLKPDRTYYYMPVVGGVDNTAHIGRFKTMPNPGTPSSFRFAYFADVDTGTASHASRELDGFDPLYVIMGGDLHYENIATSSQQAFFDAYDTFHSCPYNMEIFHHRPVAYTWDDHDFGPSNSDSTSPSREAAQLSYRNSTAHHALPEGENVAKPIYHSFVMGRVRCIVTDGRSARSPSSDPDTGSKSMLGAAQKAWLKTELIAAKNAQQFILFITSVPWNSTTNNDTWFGYANERRELADFMQLNDIKNVAKLSGDHHFIALDDGSNDIFTTDLVGNGHVTFIAAPFEQNPIGVADGAYSHGLVETTGQFGALTFSDSGSAEMTVTYSGRRGPVEVLVFTKTYQLTAATSGAGSILGTYANIQASIAAWLNRAGEEEIEARIPEFIQMLEDDLRSDQEWNLERYSHRNSGELLVLEENPAILPNYVREVRGLWTGVGLPIRIVTDEVWREHVFNNAGAGGVPLIARVTPLMQTWMGTEGARLDLWPVPSFPFEVDMLYLRELEPLAQALNGTALSQRHPNVYIYGALKHAEPFLEHDERGAMFEQRYAQAIKRIKIEVERAQYAASSMRKARLPVVFS